MPKAGTKHKAPKKGYDFYGPKYKWAVGRVEQSSYIAGEDVKKLGHKTRTQFQAARTLESVIRMSLESKTIAGLREEAKHQGELGVAAEVAPFQGVYQQEEDPLADEEPFSQDLILTDTEEDEDEEFFPGGIEGGSKDITLMGVPFLVTNEEFEATDPPIEGSVASIYDDNFEHLGKVMDFNNALDAEEWDIEWLGDGVLELFADHGVSLEDIQAQNEERSEGFEWFPPTEGAPKEKGEYIKMPDQTPVGSEDKDYVPWSYRGVEYWVRTDEDPMTVGKWKEQNDVFGKKKKHYRVYEHSPEGWRPVGYRVAKTFGIYKPPSKGGPLDTDPLEWIQDEFLPSGRTGIVFSVPDFDDPEGVGQENYYAKEQRKLRREKHERRVASLN